MMYAGSKSRDNPTIVVKLNVTTLEHNASGVKLSAAESDKKESSL